MNAHGSLPDDRDIQQPPNGQQRPWLDVSTPSGYGYNDPKSFLKFMRYK